VPGIYESPVGYFYRGLAYKNKGEYNKAIADFSQSIRYNPKNPVIYNYRGNAYQKKGDYRKAQADYALSIKLDKHSDLPYFNMACLYAVLNKKTEACLWLSKAVDRGYANWAQMKSTSDLETIRDQSCYTDIIKGK
jgi:tetratricopeptide (TPR) repeat protein